MRRNNPSKSIAKTATPVPTDSANVARVRAKFAPSIVLSRHKTARILEQVKAKVLAEHGVKEINKLDPKRYAPILLWEETKKHLDARKISIEEYKSYLTQLRDETESLNKISLTKVEFAEIVTRLSQEQPAYAEQLNKLQSGWQADIDKLAECQRQQMKHKTNIMMPMVAGKKTV